MAHKYSKKNIQAERPEGDRPWRGNQDKKPVKYNMKQKKT